MARRGENIRKRKDGRWEGRYHVYDPQSGKNTVHSVYARTYGEVKEKLAAARLSAASPTGGKACGEDACFQIVAEEWLAAVRDTKKHATYTKYRFIYDTHIREKVGNRSFSELDGEILACVFGRTGGTTLSESVQKSISCVVKQIFSYADARYHVGPIPNIGKGQSGGKKSVEVLNLTEQGRLLHCLYDGMDLYKMGIVLCISTGLRLGEICSLKWEDIDLPGKMLYVNTTVQRIAVEGEATKTVLLEGEPKSIFSKRGIPLSDEMIRLLSLYVDGNAKYVLNKNKPMEPRTYQNKFQSYLKAAGIERKNFHMLRHTFATNCVDNGTDIKSLSEILGYSDVRITLNRYVHPTMDSRRMQIDRLPDFYGQIRGQVA